MKTIYIVGSGYVGLANGTALSEECSVHFIDTDKSKVGKINSAISPLSENDLQFAITRNKHHIEASTNIDDIEDGAMVLLALPTDYDEETGYFNTEILRSVIQYLSKEKRKCVLVVKSTVPIGFTRECRANFGNQNIYFSPEFLREGRSYYDATNPDRIVVAPNEEHAESILSLLASFATNEDKKTIICGMEEAEAIKLFSNAYLAMRVAYINELDSFAIEKNLNASEIIAGMCADKRIGEGYNNPSFGYGGYCFPKDTKQLKANFYGIPNSIVSGIVESNTMRIDYLAHDLVTRYEGTIGFYRLSMKQGSDNIRSSSSTELAIRVAAMGKKVVIFEPLCGAELFFAYPNITVENSKTIFMESVEVVVMNREDKVIVNKKIYTRDVFNEN